MRLSDARSLLGVPHNAPLSQVKAAYKRKALESHPDLLPPNLKCHAEAEFRLITEAYTCLKDGNATRPGQFPPENYSGTARGVLKKGSRMHYAAASLPFVFLIVGTLCFGGFRATRAYKKQQQDSPSRNPFLP